MRKVLSKLISSFICIGVIAWLVMGSVQARFSDIEVSQNNNFTAGTLDLKTDNNDGVTATLLLVTLKPGDTSGTKTVTLKNSGNLNGSSLDIDFSYSNDDGTNPSWDTGTKTADEFADELLVTELTYDGINLLSGITDSDGDGKDMKEVAAANLTGQSGLVANEAVSKNFTIAVQLKSSSTVTSDFCADGISLVISFTLNR